MANRRKFARGTHSKAMSDRDGMKYSYSEMRQEWNGLWVHKDEFETKHPQLEPRSATDATTLKNARPNRDDDGATVQGQAFQPVRATFHLNQVEVSIA